MASLSTTMTAAVERGMRLASVDFARDVIGELNKEGVLTCSLEDAMKLFDFESVSIVSSRSKASKKRENAKSRGGEKKSSKPKITAKPSVVLPFCGVIVDDWCAGVKFNHGLHTQCTQGRCKDDRYCKTCRKHADNSATGKPPYGDIEDRANYGVDYRDPKGKMTVPYANVAEKMGISLEAAHTAAANMEWEIPAEQLVKRVAKRGRPAKSAAVSDTDSEDDESKTSTKKKRGRPTKPKAKPTTQEDQIAMLVAEAYAETASTKTVKKAKKPKVTAEEKAAAKLAKKEAEKEAAKLAKKEAAEKLKAEKKAEKEAAKLAKKEAADKLKAEKLAAKKLEKEQKAAAKATAKAEKLALAKSKAAKKKAAKKSKTAKLKVPVAEVKPVVVVEEKTAVEAAVVEEAVVEADLFLGTDDVAAQQSVMPKSDELDFEEIDDHADSSDDEEAGLELSETMTVGGVEYFFTEQDGQTILFTKDGEPVGIYDADTDTVQECEFDED